MTKKNFLPARIVQGKIWYITYTQFNPETEERVRFRKTFGLNYIADKKERFREAKRHISRINQLLHVGWPFVDPEELEELVTLEEAVQLTVKVKSQLTDRKKTRDTYSSISNIFLEYSKGKKLDKKSITKFQLKQAHQFMDYLLVERGLSAKTYNNYLIILKSFWSTMVEREILSENVWKNIKKLAPNQKTRRIFSSEEKQIIANRVKQESEFLFYAVLLLYYCFIRPAELARLRFRDMDLKRGLVILPGTITKNKKRRVVTIPESAVQYFQNPRFTKYPANYLIFGSGLKPHSSKAVGRNTFNKIHRGILIKLKNEGKISDITGLSFYSWKDTGITEMSNEVSLINLQRQAGHSKSETTLIYYQPDEVNKEVREVKLDIFYSKNI